MFENINFIIAARKANGEEKLPIQREEDVDERKEFGGKGTYVSNQKK